MDLRNQLDGYRLEVVRRGLETTLYSRRQNLLNQKLPYIAAALNSLPDDTVIDGEVVAMAQTGGQISIGCRTFAAALVI